MRTDSDAEILLLERMSPRVVYAVLGAALSVGAPVGLLLVRVAAGEGDWVSWLAREIATDGRTYAYVTTSTMVVFTLFGWLLGRQADRLIELSTTDGLTGILNVRGFRQRLQQELARARRWQQPLSLVIIDLDGLKQINDRHGHEAGDRALRAVAQTLRDTLRLTDVAARVGGDEFTLLAANTPETAAVTLAERIRVRATGPQSPLALLAASLSLGVVTFDPAQNNSADAAALRRAADEALYEAKRAGGNRVTAARLARTA